MNKKKEVKKDKDKKQIADDYSKKITYSTSKWKVWFAGYCWDVSM
ncbi:hypothetical protein [Ureaplasma urealyticum]|nr:hypothetical protein [Ureaplasma urealyticum]